MELCAAVREGSPDDLVVKHLIVPRSGQYVFKDIVQHYLQQIIFDEDKYAPPSDCPSTGQLMWCWIHTAGTASRYSTAAVHG